MQIKNIKVIRTKDNSLYIFYYSNGSVFCRKTTKNEAPPTMRVMDEVMPSYSVCAADDGIYLLLTRKSDVMLCFYDYKRWVSKPLSDMADRSITDISFMLSGSLLRLVYSMKTSSGEELYIRSAKGGVWSSPIKIDDILPLKSSAYFLSKTDEFTYSLNYRYTDNSICRRMIDLTDSGISEKEVLLSTSLPCIDISILNKDNTCHLLYLTKNRFSSQLIYKGIDKHRQSKARVIWEGYLEGSCLLFNCLGRLYALIYGGDSSYITYSDDGGINFLPGRKMNMDMLSHCLKAYYLNNSTENGFCSDEVIVDTDNFSFPLINELYPSFIPEKEEIPVKETPSQDTALKASEFDEQLLNLNSQIEELSKALAKRTEEITTVNASWVRKYEALKRENSALKKQIAEADKKLTETSAPDENPLSDNAQ